MLPLYLVFWCRICSRLLSLTPLTNGKGLQDLAWLLTAFDRETARRLYPYLEHWISVSYKVRFDQVSQRFMLAKWSDGSWIKWEQQRERERKRGRVWDTEWKRSGMKWNGITRVSRQQLIKRMQMRRGSQRLMKGWAEKKKGETGMRVEVWMKTRGDDRDRVQEISSVYHRDQG